MQPAHRGRAVLLTSVAKALKRRCSNSSMQRPLKGRPRPRGTRRARLHSTVGQATPNRGVAQQSQAPVRQGAEPKPEDRCKAATPPPTTTPPEAKNPCRKEASRGRAKHLSGKGQYPSQKTDARQPRRTLLWTQVTRLHTDRLATGTERGCPPQRRSIEGEQSH